MKPSEVYLRAAERVDRQIYCFSCIVVDEVVGGFLTDERRQYDKMFGYRRSAAWGSYFGDTDEECKSCRVLALLFMSEIAKDSE